MSSHRSQIWGGLRVALVFGSTIAAWRSSLGSPSVAAATVLNLDALVGPTSGAATLGQPITVSWNFGEVAPAEGDPAPALAALPVDIVLLDSASKATKIATGELGGFDEDGIATRTFTFRPSGKLKAGSYTVKVTASGISESRPVATKHARRRLVALELTAASA